MVYSKIRFFTSWMDSSGESRDTCFFVNYKRGLTLPKLNPLFFRIFRQRYGKSDNKRDRPCKVRNKNTIFAEESNFTVLQI